MLYGINETREGRILTICDKELLGLKLKSHSFEFHVNPSFFGTEKLDGRKINSLLEGIDTINAIGKKSFQLLENKKLIQPNSTIYIAGEPKTIINLRKTEA